jgi:D-amino-acid dehydrogenase
MEKSGAGNGPFYAGLSLGAGTGKLVSEILNEQQLSMDIAPFRVNRFD